MENKKMLFFRTVANDDATDGIDDCVCLPASRLVSISPTDDTTVTMYFDSVKLNTLVNHENIAMDSVALTVTQGDTFEVCNELIRIINSNPHSDGFIVVADDSNSVFASDHITGCAITITAEA